MLALVRNRAYAARQQRIEQLQKKIRERAAAQDWDAVVAVSEELARLDPTAADPDDLASAAREQITRRQEAERAALGVQHSVDDLLTDRGELPRATAGTPGLTLASQAGAGPVAGPAPPQDGGSGRSTSPPHDDHLPVAADGPEPGPGKEAPQARRPRRAIRRRPAIIAATAIGIAVIGLVIAITIIPGMPSTSVRWAYTSGNLVISSPAVAGGSVYVGSQDHKVYALNAATGHLRWAYTTGGQVGSSFFLSGQAVAAGTVYVGSDDPGGWIRRYCFLR